MGFLVALRFLTAVPLPFQDVSTGYLSRSTAYFPLVGLILGGILAGLDLLLRLVFPVSVASAGVVIAMILLTGGLHLDGLMDCCDGLFGRRDPERRLEIMRDSRIGSFGALGAFGLLLMQYSTLVELPEQWRLGGLAIMPVVGRWAMVLALWGFPYARSMGIGVAFKEGLGWQQVILASAVATLAAVGLLQLVGAIALIVGAVSAWLLANFICTRIPGLTGDTYGAINEVAQVTSLLAILALARGG